jgi:hypothetical protein
MCRRLASGIAGDPAAETLGKMADDIEADIIRIEAERVERASVRGIEIRPE